VKTGQVSFEFRNFVRDPADLAAACSPLQRPGALLPADRAAVRRAGEWLGKLQTMPPAEQQQLQSMPPAAGGRQRSPSRPG
jgi:hypothetical protein